MKAVRGGFFLKTVRSERGSVLLFSLAFGAMLAVVIMALSTQVTSAMDSQKSRLLHNEYIEFVESIRTQLNDPFLCASLLAGQSFNGNTVTSSVPGFFTGLATSFGSNTDPIQLNPVWRSKPGGGGIEIGQIQVVKDTYLDPNTHVITDVPVSTMIMADSSNGTPYQVWRVVLTLVPNVPRVNINRDYLKIPLTLLTRGTSVQGCHGPNSSAAQCLAIGGAFDWRPSNSEGFSYPKQRCNPDIRSFYANKTSSSSDPLIVAPNQDEANKQCPTPYTAIPVGTFMDGQPRWLCRWQNNNRFSL